MKSARTLMHVILGLFLLTSSFSHVFAQEDEREPCKPEDLQAWDDGSEQLFVRFRDAIGGGDPGPEKLANVTTDNSIQLIAVLQGIRREMDTLPGLLCPRVLMEYATFEEFFIVGTDAVAATLAGNIDTAALWTRVKELNDQIRYNMIPNRLPDQSVAFITLPGAGASVGLEQQIRGTYNPQQLGDNQLWVFVAHLIPEEGKKVGVLYYFAQQIYLCGDDPNTPDETEERRSMEYDELGGIWYVDGVIGTSTDRGPVRIVLTLATPDVAAEAERQIIEECAKSPTEDTDDNDVLVDDRGFRMTYTELIDTGFVVLDYIEVTRR